MFFIGQSHIMNQLRFILPNLWKNPSQGSNILLVGPSGYGKTTMALKICEYLAGKDFEFHLGTDKEFPLKKRVVFIDEVHKMTDHEIFYPIMDEKSHVLIFASNEHGGLPEPFVNRCFEFIFDSYDDEELLLIAVSYSPFSTSDENYMKIIAASNRNPRVLKSLIDRLALYFTDSSGGLNSSKNADYDRILSDIFQIFDGMDTLARRYLEVLESVGGTASLSLMKNILKAPGEILQNQVEPVLLQKGKIRITSKGRKLV